MSNHKMTLIDSSDVRDIAVDYTDFLVDGDTLASAAWEVSPDDGLITVTPGSVSSPNAPARITAATGAGGNYYDVSCQGTTAAGEKETVIIQLYVQRD